MGEREQQRAFKTLSKSAQVILVQALLPNAHDGVIDLSQRTIAGMVNMASKTVVKAKRELVRSGFLIPHEDGVERKHICFTLSPAAAQIASQEPILVPAWRRNKAHSNTDRLVRPRVAVLVHDGSEIAHYVDGCLIVSKRLPRVAESLEWYARRDLIERSFYELGVRILQHGWRRIAQRGGKFVVSRGFVKEDNVLEIGDTSPEIRGLYYAGMFEWGCRPTRLRTRWRPITERLWSTVVILV